MSKPKKIYVSLVDPRTVFEPKKGPKITGKDEPYEADENDPVILHGLKVKILKRVPKPETKASVSTKEGQTS